MKKKVVSSINGNEKNIMKFMLFAFVFTFFAANPAMAGVSGDSAKSIFKFVLNLLAIGAIAAGVITGVTGAIAYAEAKSEGEGPGMAKARNQIIAAVMLGVVGAAITGMADTLASYLQFSAG